MRKRDILQVSAPWDSISGFKMCKVPLVILMTFNQCRLKQKGRKGATTKKMLVENTEMGMREEKMEGR